MCLSVAGGGSYKVYDFRCGIVRCHGSISPHPYPLQVCKNTVYHVPLWYHALPWLDPYHWVRSGPVRARVEALVDAWTELIEIEATERIEATEARGAGAGAGAGVGAGAGEEAGA